MPTNLFPAIVIAGPPHAGKSVLAFLLTQRLREIGVSHYLLRAAPDGEGDWFYLGQPGLVRTLRLRHKTPYTPPFITHMQTVIEKRLVPLLVDVGGRPEGEEFGILKACTHSILIYRTQDEQAAWQKMLADLDLLPMAELRSDLAGDDRLEQTRPVLRGVIGGLERDESKRTAGEVFGAVLDRVAGVCHYEAAFLEQVHRRHAPLPFLSERQLAGQLGATRQGEMPFWEPRQLSQVCASVPRGSPFALYGRGPVWLAAALAVHALPALYSIFDARYGWVTVPEVRFGRRVNVHVQVTPCENVDADWVEVSLPGGVIEAEKIRAAPLAGERGIILSGKLPRWLFAALARQLAAQRAWIGIDEPRAGRVVVVHSHTPNVAQGETVSRPVNIPVSGDA